MFGRGIRLFKVFGFSVEVDASWLIIAALVTWTLATGYFPVYAPHLSEATYWWMGAAGAGGLFVSIVLHELSHSLVARRYGLEMRGIRLFIFGGVAQMDEEPRSPLAEFMMAIAGPIASVLIAAASFGLYYLGTRSAWPTPAVAVLFYLFWINGLLAAFNLIPAFPLDGGRVLRSILWKLNGNLTWATRIASYIGVAFAVLLVVLGVTSLFANNLVGGIWWILLGLFLWAASKGSYRQLLIQDVLTGERVSRLMRTEVHTVPPSLTIQEFVDDYVYRYHFKMFPVTENGHVTGCITTRHVGELSRDEWTRQTVGDLTEPCSAENSVAPDADLLQALKKMTRDGRSRLLVVERDELRGVISLKDVSRFISLKTEMER